MGHPLYFMSHIKVKLFHYWLSKSFCLLTFSICSSRNRREAVRTDSYSSFNLSYFCTRQLYWTSASTFSSRQSYLFNNKKRNCNFKVIWRFLSIFTLIFSSHDKFWFSRSRFLRLICSQRFSTSTILKFKNLIHKI